MIFKNRRALTSNSDPQNGKPDGQVLDVIQLTAAACSAALSPQGTHGVDESSVQQRAGQEPNTPLEYELEAKGESPLVIRNRSAKQHITLRTTEYYHRPQKLAPAVVVTQPMILLLISDWYVI